MGAPRRPPRSGRHSQTAPLPSRSPSAPAGGIPLKPQAWFSSHAPRAYTAGARRRRQRRAGRRQERGRGQSREARPAERSAAGCLDGVGKVLPRWAQVLAVVAPDVGACFIEGVQQADRVDLEHALGDPFRGEPLDCGRLVGRALRAPGRLAPEDHGDDTAAGVLVDARELVGLDTDTSAEEPPLPCFNVRSVNSIVAGMSAPERRIASPQANTREQSVVTREHSRTSRGAFRSAPLPVPRCRPARKR